VDPTAEELRLAGAQADARRFGDFELVEELGRGGMGVVYRARQVSLDRWVALKMILDGHFASPTFVERFRAEARAAANLQHPNIVPLYEVGERDGLLYFSMELVVGPSLAEALRDGAFPPQRAAACLKTVAEAVHYAHQRGILHRDLKPSNILLDATGEPRLTDFGLAKRFVLEPAQPAGSATPEVGCSGACPSGGRLPSAADPASLTLTGQVLGSPNYIPPEQASGKRGEVGPWTDVYSLGAILYHLLTGRPPFQAGTIPDTLHEVLSSEPVPPRRLNASLPRDLETVCLKCLAKEPSRRYPTAQALAEDLARFLAGRPVRARPVTPPERVWRWCRRRPALALAIVALHVVLALGLAGILWQWRRAEQNLYIANIGRAFEALAEGDLSSVGNWLALIERSPIQRAMRGWEWRYLMGRRDGDQLAVLGRHDSWISALAGSPDRRWLASSSEDGVVTLWDWEARREVARWPAHSNVVAQYPWTRLHPLVFALDGAQLVTAGADEMIRGWTVEPLPKLVWSTSGETVRLACSGDGRLLASGGMWGRLALWRLSDRSGELITNWHSGLLVLIGFAMAPDGSALFAGGAERPVLRYDLSGPALSSPPEPFPGSAPPVAVSPDGAWLATAGANRNQVLVWRLSAPAEPWRSFDTQGGGIRTLAFSLDSQYLAAGLLNGGIVLFDLAGQAPPRTLLGHTDLVTGLVFSADGRTLASSSYDRTVRLWGTLAATGSGAVVKHGRLAHAVGFSPDSRHLGSVADEAIPTSEGAVRSAYSLKLWRLDDLAEVAAVTNRGWGHTPHVSFSPSSQEVAVDDWQTNRFYRVPTLEPVLGAGERFAVFAPDSPWRAYVSQGRALWRASPAAPEQVLGDFTNRVSILALSPTGHLLAVGDTDGAIHLWDVRRERRHRTLWGHEAEVICLAFSPNGRMLASAGDDALLGLWDVASGERRMLLPVHGGGLNWAAFASDGRTLATGGGDGTVRLWSVELGQQLTVLRDHTAAVNGVAFSPDGQWLASASDDGTVRLWRAP
jgi:WD40 repeat protein/serine/threonine protein kinase